MECQSRSVFRDESGTVIVLTALLLVALMGFVALVIDIGHIIVVKNELQNAADAGAMAGARNLVPYISDNPVRPDWSTAQTVAAAATKANTTDRVQLTDCQVQVGYWNLLHNELRSSGITPTSVDVPAVTVRVAKAEGQNAGSVVLTFARVLGIDFANVSANSTAMISCPGNGPPKSLFPISLNLDFVKKNFMNDNLPSFKIGSDYHYNPENPNMCAGQWTSFFDVANDSQTIRDLMYNGNPDNVRMEQSIQNLSDIYVQPGTKNALYKDAASKIGETVWVPVVDNFTLDTHGWNPVRCYVPLKIKDSVGQNKKYIEAQFDVGALLNSDDVRGGECFGGYTPPKIVQ